MYYILIRVWTALAFGLSLLLGYYFVSHSDQLAEMSLFLGCGTGLLLWVVGVILLAALLRPKRTHELFEDRRPPIDHRTPA